MEDPQQAAMKRSGSEKQMEQYEVYEIYPPAISCSVPLCTLCKEQYHSEEEQQKRLLIYTSYKTTQEANELIKKYTESIFGNFVYLREQIAKFGGTIVNKWKKKSRPKRELAMKTAFPKIRHNRANLLWFFRIFEEPFQEAVREAYLLPYMDITSYADDPYRLFALLYARTQHVPAAWAAFDDLQLEIAWQIAKVDVSYSNCYVSLSPQDYGKIVGWNEEKAYHGKICAFPKAALIFEAQYLLMKGLRRIIEGLLSNTVADSRTAKWQSLASTGFWGGTVGSESWSVVTNYELTTPVVDLSKLIEIATAQHAEAIDHLWLLQTDMPYLLHQIRVSMDCVSLSNLRDEDLDTPLSYTLMSFHLWAQPMSEAVRWSHTIEELKHAKNLYDKMPHQGQHATEDLITALTCLHALLTAQEVVQRKSLRSLLPRHPKYHQYYDARVFRGGALTKVKDLNTRDPRQSRDFFQEHPQFMCLLCISGEAEDDGSRLQLSPSLRTLEEVFFDENSQTGASLDDSTLHKISAAAATHEILVALEVLRPSFPKMSKAAARKKFRPDRSGWKSDWGSPSIRPDHLIKNIVDSFTALEQSVMPSGKRNAAWLDKMDTLRAARTRYFEECRKVHSWQLDKRVFFTADRDCDKAQLESLLHFEQDPAYVATVAAERDSILSTKTDRVVHKYEKQPWMESTASEPLNIVKTVNTKKKTRPVDCDLPLSSTLDKSPSQSMSSAYEKLLLQRPVQRPFQGLQVFVPAQHIRTLRRLFSTQDDSAGRDLEWRVFVAAMKSAGFNVTSSGGSATAFISDGNNNASGRIVFHKPHPSSRILPVILQSWGQRMTKRFGWERDSFVDVKEKQEAAEKVDGQDD